MPCGSRRSKAALELERCAPDRALDTVFGFVQACNLQVSRTEPWKPAHALLVPESPELRERIRGELFQLLGDAARALLWIAGLLGPFLPDAAARIARALGTPLPCVYRTTPPDWVELAAGARIECGDVLFGKLEASASVREH